ncbi:odorant receptor Or1-like [Schistocerca gregaria]|uniref:odorant receptor Or1-like n=1 Tax=Schistocerca gregaria TaxID=7010 RepID=UPI00211EE795|nr:odorant receptor Or1-like [Schistocerca gregaria]
MRQWERESIRLMGISAAAFRLLGIWPDGGRRDGGRRDGDGPVGALLLAANDVSLGVFALAYVLMESARDLKSLSDAFFVIATSVSVSSRIFLLTGQKDLMQELVTLLMKARKSFPESVPGIRARYQRLAIIMFRIWQVLPMFPLTLWVLEPVLLVKFSTREANVTAESLRNTPLPVWLPIDIHRSPNYEITYALQATSLILAIGFNGFFDIIYVVFMVHITAELDVLNQNISRMKTGGEENAADSRGPYITRVKLESDYKSAMAPVQFRQRLSSFPGDLGEEDRMYFILVENIKHHQLILV